VRDPERRARLAELCGGQVQVAEAGLFLVVCADQRRHRSAAASQGRGLAPNLESFLVGVIDAALFAQNLALAFEAEGYGICFIGGLRNDLAAVDALLEVPADVLPLFGLCAGVPDEDPEPRPRLGTDAVLFDERWPSADAAEIARYDEVLGAHYARRGRPGWTWSGSVSRKLERPNRMELREYYQRKGARLE
jgi:nitroreductase